jgi:LacI family transcriptional regulator
LRKKRPTLKDVAKAAGVSVASASYAVNKTGSLGQDTREYILRVAEEIGYRQNLAARAARTGRSGAIGLVVPDMTNPFFPSLAQAVIQRARQGGHSVLVTDTEGDVDQETKIIRQLLDRDVDGIVWFPVNDSNHLGELSTDVPFVVIDRSVPSLECIHADYMEGGRLAAQHLIDLGHQQIGLISGPSDVKSMRDRCDGAVRAITESAALAFTVENAFSIELSKDVTDALIARKATAVFCASDLIALGVLKYAREVGIRIPQDLSIVGFDDIPWAEYCTPGLTTIEMPVEEMATEAVDTVLSRIDGDIETNRRVVFGVSLIVRESTEESAT